VAEAKSAAAWRPLCGKKIARQITFDAAGCLCTLVGGKKRLKKTTLVVVGACEIAGAPVAP